MKYIQKTDIPQFFLDDTKNLSNWNSYEASDKRKLRKHCLENEQNYLCAYCEKLIDVDSSHSEHIEPKSNDIDKLTFDYYNLIVSCEGNCRLSENPEKYKESCGHKKDDKFNKELFLNPTIVKNIIDYFEYNNMGDIGYSLKDIEKAKYTLELLNLNSKKIGLSRARVKTLKKFKVDVKKLSQKYKKMKMK